MISLSPTPVKRPFYDEDGEMNVNNQGDEFHRADFSDLKRARRTCQFGDNSAVDNNSFQFPISSSSSTSVNSSMNSRTYLANEENQSPMKTNTNRFIFTNLPMKDKRRRMDESPGRSRDCNDPGLSSVGDIHVNNIHCNRDNDREICSNNNSDNRDFKCSASNNFIMPMNPVHMQTMYEAQLANLKKEISQKNGEIHALNVKNNALFEDSKILKKAVNIQESRQKEMASYNQQLESTLGQAIEHIAGLEKVVQSLKSQLYGNMGTGPSYYLDKPPPDVF